MKDVYKCLELRLIESAFSLFTAGIRFRHLTGRIKKLRLNCEEDPVIPWGVVFVNGAV